MNLPTRGSGLFVIVGGARIEKGACGGCHCGRGKNREGGVWGLSLWAGKNREGAGVGVVIMGRE